MRAAPSANHTQPIRASSSHLVTVHHQRKSFQFHDVLFVQCCSFTTNKAWAIPGTYVQYLGLQGGGALGDALTPGTPAGSMAASAHGTVGLRPCTWKILYLLEYNWIQADTSIDFLYGSGAFRTKFLYGACTTLARSAPNRCMNLARCRADCLYLVARRSYRRYMQLV